MKFSEAWLRELVDPELSCKDLVAQITMAGVEVDSVEAATSITEAVVVGEIVAIAAHPDADKLRVCEVNAGIATSIQVVCGAPNARVGIKVPLARVGALLPDDFTIKAAKIRGIASEGMLCAATELQLGDDDDGLWELPGDAPVGMSLVDYLGLADNIIEVDLTPNRGDCLSIRGLAREIGVLNQLPVGAIDCSPVAATLEDTLPVEIQAPQGCARYVGRVVRDLDLARPTPQWMQEKLRRSGIRSLGPAVDVTNYVMLELGQPMHAFDLATLDGGIVVRMGQGETLQLLDDSEARVTSDTLLIADHSKPLALAGVMGGAASAVGAATRDIFFESAWFNPLAIAGKARAFGKHTDSSHRYERGVDSGLQVAAIERATALMLSICGGAAGPVVIEEASTELPQRPSIRLRNARLAQQLGVDLPTELVDDMLQRLGLENRGRDAAGSTWIAPSWRFDLAIEQDLVEEVARIYGYNKLPTTTPKMALEIQPVPERQPELSLFRQQLVSSGYREVITYSFVDPAMQALLEPQQPAVALTNPISSDMAVMRTSLWPGLLSTAIHNLNRQQSRVRIFESGQCFISSAEGLTQNSALAGAICGTRHASDWTSSKQMVDFFDVKGDVEALLARTAQSAHYSFMAAEHAALHPGQSASILRDGEAMGWLGALHPKIQRQLGLSQPIYLFQLDLAGLLHVALPAYRDISKFPEVRRDLAFFVDPAVSAAAVLSAARSAAGSDVIDVALFDVYRDDKSQDQLKSLAVSLTFQRTDRTLTDEEVNDAVEKTLAALVNACGAQLRG